VSTAKAPEEHFFPKWHKKLNNSKGSPVLKIQQNKHSVARKKGETRTEASATRAPSNAG
jgi:hypothetical protein